MREDLLQPELGGGRDHVPLYSARAGFYVAFLGGPIAIALFSALNSKRLGRLHKDIYVYLLVSIAALSFLVFGANNLELFSFGSSNDNPRRNLRLAFQLVGLLSFGLYYLMHKRNYRSEQIFGESPPSPWSAGILCTLGAIAISFAVLALANVNQG
jgi:hypothetical protein